MTSQLGSRCDELSLTSFDVRLGHCHRGENAGAKCAIKFLIKFVVLV